MGQALSATERKILGAVLHDSRRTVEEVARETKLRHHSVVYALRSLRERGVIRPFLLTNPHALGLTDFRIFFNQSGEERGARKKVIQYCMQSPQVAYFAELTGAYQYSVSLFCRTIFEVTDFFRTLGRQLPKASFDMSFATRARWTEFHGKRFLPKSGCQVRDRTAVAAETTIDPLDRKLLSTYSLHTGLSLSRISSMIGTSESTLRYRLKSLEERQVVLGLPYVLDRAAAGLMTFRIMIAAKGLDPKLHTELLSFSRQHEASSAFVRCVGAWDFEISFDVEQPKDFGSIVEEVHDRFGAHIRQSHTVTEMVVHRAHHFPHSAGLREGATEI